MYFLIYAEMKPLMLQELSGWLCGTYGITETTVYVEWPQGQTEECCYACCTYDEWMVSCQQKTANSVPDDRNVILMRAFVM
jgi:hypothetical protein